MAARELRPRAAWFRTLPDEYQIASGRGAENNGLPMNTDPNETDETISAAPHRSRREFMKCSALTLAALALGQKVEAQTTDNDVLGLLSKRPDSKFAGVQLGLNVPYSFGDMKMSGPDILANCVKLGLSAVELRTQPIEAFLSAPRDANELRGWRESVAVSRANEFRQLYEKTGVAIEIVKVDGIFKMSDGELDYVFTLGKTLGARALSTEISHQDDDLKRVGQFADKHQLLVGYHGHASTKPEHWERAFALAQYNGANVDLGHFVAGLNTSPVPFLKQYHARIPHVHVKDRKFNNGPNTPFGEGDTPIVEVLHLIRDQQWPMQATIEFEYPVPAGSDRMTEIARAIRYCRKALV